ncbi:hypothetical protein Hypma_002428 [Hypsizygus marmoreus]|uniref:Cyanovirin-N domain-containing protein n=1 Tax=Hypsizygus marmoreus TaxID=39966 RepID=A0A369J671_HYPMA|nr:hypothetical protein Hypma_002428 [Hypsizygus marmoreus]
MPFSLFAVLPFALFSIIAASPLAVGTVCKGHVTVTESFIGKDHDVKVEVATCPGIPLQPRMALEHRQSNQTNICATACNTNCFLPAGGGPDPNECHVITDALRYESENTGALFQVGTGVNNTVVMTYRGCRSSFVNQDLGAVVYCRTNWADILDSLAFNCQTPQNAHGGNCVATDQRYFIQAQHS